MSEQVMPRQLTILFVEDEPLIGLTLLDMLEELGHRPLEASSAAEALTIFRDTPRVDLVISDLGLPDMPGDVLARELRAIVPGLPVIFASGSPPRHEQGDAPTLHISKPFRMEELRDAIVSVTKT
jgi:CheY-like chemotaxis protein